MEQRRHQPHGAAQSEPTHACDICGQPQYANGYDIHTGMCVLIQDLQKQVKDLEASLNQAPKPRVTPYDVTCPTCKAKPWDPCMAHYEDMMGRHSVSASHTHDARHRLAEDR